uniref:p5 n=1 Tax=Lettuce infectious yellows virus TaxID=31713 RepID=Q9IZR3_LIYV|nr:P5 [Lettuce infectious yellows virus]
MSILLFFLMSILVWFIFTILKLLFVNADSEVNIPNKSRF